MMVEIYTKEDCPFCTQTKQLLRDRQIGFNEYKLNEDFTREIILEKFPDARSFPIIVVNGYRVGGYNDFKKYLIIEQESKDNRRLLNESTYNV